MTDLEYLQENPDWKGDLEISQKEFDLITQFENSLFQEINNCNRTYLLKSEQILGIFIILKRGGRFDFSKFINILDALNKSI